MDYFFYNTDANSLSRDHSFPILIKQGIAATSGPIRFGNELGKLSPGDTLLMYENRLGVVAVGTVLEQWDGKTHTPPLYYLPGDDGFDHEYRIKVTTGSNKSGTVAAREMLRITLSPVCGRFQIYCSE